jgi:hypothetical protein
MIDQEHPTLAVAEEPVPAGQEALTIRFSTGLLALPEAELRLFSSPLDLVTRETLPREGKRFPLPPGDYGIRLKARLGPAAKEVVRLEPQTHLTVEVRLAEVWRLHQEESSGSFNRAFQTFEMEERAKGWDGPPF